MGCEPGATVTDDSVRVSMVTDHFLMDEITDKDGRGIGHGFCYDPLAKIVNCHQDMFISSGGSSKRTDVVDSHQ